LACSDGKDLVDTGPFDADGDGVIAAEDCNDEDPDIHPFALEICDGVDNNCDGAIDEGVETEWWFDLDGDGYGGDSASVLACEPPDGYAEASDDCDDNDAAVNPGAEEDCNGLDDNCDGIADDGATTFWYTDADGDGYGDPATEFEDCLDNTGFVTDGTDCDDDDAAINPGAEEVCDGDDDNCDGRPDLIEVSRWYSDADSDGWGHPAEYEDTCAPDEGWVLVGEDCSPNEDWVYPGAPEECNEDDEDCDGFIDEDFDLDGDGYWSDVCDGGDDCDDNDGLTFPGADEICDDGIDNDCDGKDAFCGLYGGYSAGVDTEGKFYAPTASDDAGRLVDVGDVNGDGYGDVVVATLYADGYNGGGYIVYGPMTGSESLETAGYNFLGSRETYGAGRSIGLADTNNDGFDDIIFGAPYTGSQSAFIVLGPVTGDMDLIDADVQIEGEYGTYCAHGTDLGDVNGDGYADAIIGAYYEDMGGGTASGNGYIKYGPFFASNITLRDEYDGILIGENRSAYTGRIMRGGKDYDGDGIGDLLVPAVYDSTSGPYSGSVYMVYGPASGEMSLGSSEVIIRGEAGGDYLGYSINQGDFNGDGYADAAMGAYQNSSAAGAVYVFYGNGSTGELSATDADFIARGHQASMQFGSGVGSADVDLNGSDDLVVGAPADTSSGSNTGSAYLFFGPLSGSVQSDAADAWVYGEANGDSFGTGVAAGDLNGDGWGELIIGAPGEANGGRGAGAFYVKEAEY
jgi:hypothetical protein